MILPARMRQSGGIFGIAHAGLARRIDAGLEDRRLGVRALGASSRNPRVVAGDDLERGDEAVAEVIRQRDVIGVDDRAVRLLDADIALGRQRVGALVVDHLVGEEGVVVVVDLDIALGGDLAAGVVVDQLIRLQKHRLGGVFVGFALGGDVEQVFLGEGRRRRARRAPACRRAASTSRSRGEATTTSPVCVPHTPPFCPPCALPILLVQEYRQRQ